MNQEKCPQAWNCGTHFSFEDYAETISPLCRERSAHAETRKFDVRNFVPGTYGEALEAGWINVGDCEPHEWDNRTSQENLLWVVEQRKRSLAKWKRLIRWAESGLNRFDKRTVIDEMNRLDAEEKEGK